MKKLNDVMDPELYISIVDLGLIYDLTLRAGTVTVKMTLTTMGCPLFDMLEADIKKKIMSIKTIKDVRINLVFDPPWNTEMMTEQGRAQMGI